MRVERVSSLPAGQAPLQRSPGGRVERCRERPPGQGHRSSGGVDVGDAQAADLDVGRGVQQGEQADEPLAFGGRVASPAGEQGALSVDVQHGPGEGRLSTEGQIAGGVGEDELAALGPGEEPPQDVGPLVSGGGRACEEGLQVCGGDLGPPGDSAPGVQVSGEVAQDAQPGLEGDVAEDALPGASATVLLAGTGCDRTRRRPSLKGISDGGDEPLSAGRRLLAAVCRVPARARER